MCFVFLLHCSHRRALGKVTSDQLLLAGLFFFLSLEIFAEKENSNCYPNVHRSLSETTSEQISQGYQMENRLFHTTPYITDKPRVIICMNCG